jgi:hypothetical protein
MTSHAFITIFLADAKRRADLKAAFEARGAELVNTYRHGPYTIEALFKTASGYWTTKASVDKNRAWTQRELDDEIQTALIDALDRHLHGDEEVDAHR